MNEKGRRRRKNENEEEEENISSKESVHDVTYVRTCPCGEEPEFIVRRRRRRRRSRGKEEVVQLPIFRKGVNVRGANYSWKSFYVEERFKGVERSDSRRGVRISAVYK